MIRLGVPAWRKRGVHEPGDGHGVRAGWGFHCKVNGTSCAGEVGRITVVVCAAARDGMSRIQSMSCCSAQRVAVRSVSARSMVGGLMPACSSACSQRPGAATRTSPWPYEPGHGLWLVRKIADHISVNCSPAGSQVTVAFTMLRSAMP
jgi:hypothetical protein